MSKDKIKVWMNRSLSLRTVLRQVSEQYGIKTWKSVKGRNRSKLNLKFKTPDLWSPVKKLGIVGLLVSSNATGHQTDSPGRPAGRDDRVSLLSEPFDVLFQFTLERPFCHINQGGSECRAVFSVNPEASAHADNDLLGRKVAIFVAATFCRTSPADVS